MTHGPFRLPLSDLIDRLSIELRKAFYGAENEAMIADLKQEIRGRLATLTSTQYIAAEEDVTKLMAVVVNSILLGIRNADIANCEWQIRAGQKLSLEDLGQRAVLTRKVNDARNVAKADMSKAIGENVETRHFGYGGMLDPETFMMDVQPLSPHNCGVAFKSHPNGVNDLIYFCKLPAGHKGEHHFSFQS
jgi:hypothetical protein